MLTQCYTNQAMRLFICKPQLYFFFNTQFNMMHGETKKIYFFLYLQDHDIARKEVRMADLSLQVGNKRVQMHCECKVQ